MCSKCVVLDVCLWATWNQRFQLQNGRHRPSANLTAWERSAVSHSSLQGKASSSMGGRWKGKLAGNLLIRASDGKTVLCLLARKRVALHWYRWLVRDEALRCSVFERGAFETKNDAFQCWSAYHMGNETYVSPALQNTEAQFIYYHMAWDVLPCSTLLRDQLSISCKCLFKTRFQPENVHSVFSIHSSFLESELSNPGFRYDSYRNIYMFGHPVPIPFRE